MEGKSQKIDSPEKREPTWKTPTVVVSLLTATISLGGLVVTYQKSSAEIAKMQAEIDLKDRELYDLRERERDKINRQKAHIAEIEQQIAEVDREMEECRERNARATMGADVYSRALFNSSKSQAEKDDAVEKLQYAKEMLEESSATFKKLGEKKETLEKAKRDYITSIN